MSSPDRWAIDPTRLALRGSTWRKGELPEPYCLEVGRRLLLAELEFSEWTMRRVEKIDLSRDRSVSRKVSIEFSIRDDAPEFGLSRGQRSRLVPLSMMRRRTLVNMQLRDEHDHPVAMPGLRVAQQLDQSILLAAAATIPEVDSADSLLLSIVQHAISGELAQVEWAYRRLLTGPESLLQRLRDDPLFRFVADRLMHNFSLFTFVPVNGADDRVPRMITMSFDEPADWKYQEPSLDREPSQHKDSPTVYFYQPGKEIVPRRKSMFGIDPIRIRFQVPGAECAASYHFEVKAPSGVHIVKADLLAGRPNDPNRHVSEDQVVGHTPVVGLHAVEIPNGSLCRVQVDIGVPLRGWLATVLISSAAICAVLFSVAMLWESNNPRNADQIGAVVLILVTTSAGVTTLVAQRDSGVVAARLVAGLRTICTASLVLPLFDAGWLTYSGLNKHPSHAISVAFWSAFAVSFLILLVVMLAAYNSYRIEALSLTKESPWDQTQYTIGADTPPETGAPPPADVPNYLKSMEKLEFGTGAVGVRSAEGWHERYFWTDALQEEATRRLHSLGEIRQPRVCNSVSNKCTDCPRSTGTASSVGMIAESGH